MVLTPMAEDIAARLQSDFGHRAGEASFPLMRLLRDGVVEGDRVIRCIVHLAGGDLEELRRLVSEARIDYRDVIFLAEYVDRAAQCPRRVRDFNRPFGKEEI